MRKLAPLAIAVTVLMAAVLVSSPPGVNAQSAGLVSAVLNRLERNHRDLKSLRSGISMEKYNSQLRESDKYHGQVLYIPGEGRKSGRVRVDWTEPRQEILAVNNGEFTLFQPRQRRAYRGNARSKQGSMGGVLDLINLSGRQLGAKFAVQDPYEEKLWGDVSTVHLKLVPRGPASYSYAEVWVDMDGMPVQAKVVEKNDDSTTIRLTNVERNARVSDDEFRLQLPDGVKIVRG